MIRAFSVNSTMLKRSGSRRTSLRLVGFLFLASVAFGAGCSSNKYREPITKFQTSAAVVSADARKVYSEINRLQRTALIRKHARENKVLRQDDLDKVQPLSRANLHARLDALDRLNDYVDLLVKIANSDAPQSVSKSATDLSGAIANLVGTVNGLASGENADFKVKVNNAFGVGSVIFSEVLKAFIHRKIKDGLEAAILRGAGPINELIDAIEDDLRAYQTVNLAVFHSERTDILKLYNCELAKKESVRCPEDDRTPFNGQRFETYKTQLIASDDLLESLRAADPRESLAKMKKAHLKIVLLAKSGAPADFAEAVAAIEDFAAAVKRFAEAVENLKAS